MAEMFSKLFELVLKKLQKKKQPTIKAVNSIVIIINTNKD